MTEIVKLRRRIKKLENIEIELGQLKKKLREKQEHIEATLNALPDLLFEVDCLGHIYEFHSARQELLYARPEEFIGKKVKEILPREPTAIIMSAIKRAAKKGSDFGATYSLKMTKSLNWFELSIAAKKVREDHHDRFVVLVRDITKRKQAEMEKEKLIFELKEAMSKIKMLSGLLPICASCKKIRDKKGNWHQLEIYIRDHSKAEFTHGICPKCAARLYPDPELEE